MLPNDLSKLLKRVFEMKWHFTEEEGDGETKKGGRVNVCGVRERPTKTMTVKVGSERTTVAYIAYIYIYEAYITI